MIVYDDGKALPAKLEKVINFSQGIAIAEIYGIKYIVEKIAGVWIVKRKM